MAQPQQRPEQGVVRFYNFLAEGVSFAADVLAGLAQPQKSLPPKWLYDARGRSLFEQVCASPQYYAGRAESAIMREHANAIAGFFGPGCQLIEFGNGASEQTRILIEQLRPPLYVPVDIEGEALEAAATGLERVFPWLNINGVCADSTRPLKLPEFVGVPIRRKAVYLSGSTIGRLTPQGTSDFLQLARRTVGAGGALLMGVDLKKDRATLEAACGDAAGAVAAFNLNLLARINRELGGDFQPRRFRHRAFPDDSGGWIEMCLESLASQFVHVGGRRFSFTQGETIVTATACNYAVDEFRALAQRAGFANPETWIDAGNLFSVHALVAA